MTSSFEVDLKALSATVQASGVVSFEQVRGSIGHVLNCRVGEYRHIDHGVLISLFDMKVLQPYNMRTFRRSHISFSLIRDGDYRIGVGRQKFVAKQASVRMTISAETRAQHRPRGPAAHLAGVIIFIEPAELVGRYGLSVDGLPEELRRIADGHIDGQFSLEIPLPPWSWVAVDQIIECRFAEPLRTQYIKAKATELLCELVATVNLIDRPLANFRMPAARREQTRIETAALIYRRDMRNPPSLRELAQRLGLNRNKLNQGFRTMFGLTPHEYSRRVRLEWARDRIATGAMSIREACDAVGYSSHSAFTRAYGALFGYAPSETPTTSPAHIDDMA